MIKSNSQQALSLRIKHNSTKCASIKSNNKTISMLTSGRYRHGVATECKLAKISQTNRLHATCCYVLIIYLQRIFLMLLSRRVTRRKVGEHHIFERLNDIDIDLRNIWLFGYTHVAADQRESHVSRMYLDTMSVVLIYRHSYSHLYSDYLKQNVASCF